ncbi:hypothetical protein CLIB1444_02S10264 [[Candida] jaroonii]|uniref:Uncharacterized protein n=1 Tax=[Candida] jaroonii TaxID=467808 RepID=A0ACA9Y3L1_9ASCO|nr:hypothetical protein CLIB1444_02S10264 [[Candida] jaroonii]
MPLLVKFKKSKGNKVSVTSVVSETTKQIHVRIRLPKRVLEDLEDSDLSSLEDELNQALTTDSILPRTPVKQSTQTDDEPKSLNVTLKYSPRPSSTFSSFKSNNNTQITEPDKEVKQEVPEQPNLQASKQPSTVPGYRGIPPNLTIVLKREFGLLNESSEDLEMIEKIIFTLRDPLSATKIKLPVKSITCSHFECFDFENFCVFNKIPHGIKSILKKDLIRKSFDLKKRDKFLQNTGKDFNPMSIVQLTKNFIYNPGLNEFKNVGVANQPHYPTYKCPVCNNPFELSQLFISDIINYFIKTTPMDINRIELLDMANYRIVDDLPQPKKEESHEVVMLDSDDEIDTNVPEQKDVVLPVLRGFDNNGSNNVQLPSFNMMNSEIPGFSDDSTEEEDYGKIPPPPAKFPSQRNPSQSNLPQRNPPTTTGTGSWEDPVTLD